MKELIRNKLIHQTKLVGTSIRWVIFAILSGLIVGGWVRFFILVCILSHDKDEEPVAHFSAAGQRTCDCRLLPPPS